jgi:hypothetical protein
MGWSSATRERADEEDIVCRLDTRAVTCPTNAVFTFITHLRFDPV